MGRDLEYYATDIAKKGHKFVMKSGSFSARLMRAERLVGDKVFDVLSSSAASSASGVA